MANIPFDADNGQSFPHSPSPKAGNKSSRPDQPSVLEILGTALSLLASWRNDPALKNMYDKNGG